MGATARFSRPGVVLSRALIITYHAIEPGPPPLFVQPELFQLHVETVLSEGARILNVSALVQELSEPTGAGRLVAFTFDDGFSSVARHAAPILSSYGVSATVYCVAGHVGGLNDWRTDRPGGLVSPLVSADEIRKLVSTGLEIGSHGFSHLPIPEARGEQLRQEICESRRALEQLTGSEVRTFAYPYGALPHAEARALVDEEYEAACTTRVSLVGDRPDPHALPRVDAYYLRRPEILRRAVSGSLGSYLLLRRFGSGARRAIRKDYVTV